MHLHIWRSSLYGLPAGCKGRGCKGTKPKKVCPIQRKILRNTLVPMVSPCLTRSIVQSSSHQYLSPTGANIAQKDEICSFCSYISCTVKIDESTLPEQSHLPTTPPNLKYFGLEQRTTPEEQSAVDQSFLTTSFARVLTLCCKRPVTSTSHSGNSQKG